MLYIALIVSAILLAVVNWAHFRKSSPARTAAVAGVGLGYLPIALGCLLPLVALQGILLFLGSLVGTRSASRARYFLIYSCLVTIFIYAWVGLAIFRDLESLRQLYPLEPLAERLPAPRAVPPAAPLPPASVDFLARAEQDVSTEYSGHRAGSLRYLHEDKVSAFVNSPGFGVARMSSFSREGLASGLRAERSIPQPGASDTSSLSSEALAPAPRGLDFEPLQRLHLKGFLDFVNPRGFGWLTERKQLAGFQSHHFSEVPSASEWTVQTIDLVGLVVHEKPVVYVSESLPRMSELRTASTRPLDTFELAGLETLRAGENLFVRAAPHGLRMLGGVRSVEKCIKCHGGEVGDLLGAFSYSLSGSDSKGF